MKEITTAIKVLPIHIINPRTDKEKSIYIGEELESLITTLGGTIVARIMQKMDRPDTATYIGKGKLQEVVGILKEHKIDVVILGAMAKPRQIHAIKTALQIVNPRIDVWDRVDLILRIFDKHAQTTEAKLQIKLALMRYMGPRIYGMGFVMSNQGGGIGTVGVGETNTELMKRHWRNEIKHVTDDLEKIQKNHEQRLERRKKINAVTLSLVGYTNAGKSSLFNALTHKETLVENALFATLDSTVGKIYLPALEKELFVTDTIGFIRDLPPRLIDAFKSTLMESTHADLLLHVIDVSDPEVDTKIQVVNDILKSLGIDPTAAMYVFNKIDATGINKEEVLARYKDFSPLFVSVKSGEGIDALKAAIVQRLKSKPS